MKGNICPICEKSLAGTDPSEWPQWPFCSQRCKTIDLGRWLGGVYRVEAGPIDPDEEPPNSAAPSAVQDREEA